MMAALCSTSVAMALPTQNENSKRETKKEKHRQAKASQWACGMQALGSVGHCLLRYSQYCATPENAHTIVNHADAMRNASKVNPPFALEAQLRLSLTNLPKAFTNQQKLTIYNYFHPFSAGKAASVAKKSSKNSPPAAWIPSVNSRLARTEIRPATPAMGRRLAAA
jgi:hypothetical protein